MLVVNKYVTDYINQYKQGKILFNEERKQLVDFLEDFIFPRNDLYFNDEQIENLINFAKEFYFELDDFQNFLRAFLFLY
ncbi:hypothetical protein LLE83_12240 [Staphylococcus epidermidis]|uniref:hypothetical protein n=1 Tax=Staphylococcus epidermidis TaxID=1282 RepID=UPI001D14B53E|nr:hypothetical protein [Staphylococcus epidermidis]MCC3694150.1 hypothetical protein [Staphylococcus epidermidis]